MADLSRSTYAVSGDTTEWEDILIKKGITTKEDVYLAKGLNPEDFLPKIEEEVLEEETIFEKLANASIEELDRLEDEEDLCDEGALQKYREERLQQLKSSRLKNRWGQVIEISR